ncbi:MAG: PQQ-binding-like beta-propeller repeat protein, partial [Planctomycetes bacterium]|nr:PQQ-binding-like beta-propeller repeat protein [Planctomycetota bacterium]
MERQGGRFVPTEQWHNADIAPQYNTPVLQDNLLFGLSNSGNLFCIDAETGKTAWTDSVQRERRGYGAIVGTGSCLLALFSNSEMIAFGSGAGGFE